MLYLLYYKPTKWIYYSHFINELTKSLKNYFLQIISLNVKFKSDSEAMFTLKCPNLLSSDEVKHTLWFT